VPKVALARAAREYVPAMPYATPYPGSRSMRTGYVSLCEPSSPAARAGATLPVKWRVLDADGVPVSDPRHFARLSSAAAEEDLAGGIGPQYLGDGYWQFDWHTPATYAGQLRWLTLALRDGSTRSALLAFS
jgi:hypothetical protein